MINKHNDFKAGYAAKSTYNGIRQNIDNRAATADNNSRADGHTVSMKIYNPEKEYNKRNSPIKSDNSEHNKASIRHQNSSWSFISDTVSVPEFVRPLSEFDAKTGKDFINKSAENAQNAGISKHPITTDGIKISEPNRLSGMENTCEACCSNECTDANIGEKHENKSCNHSSLPTVNRLANESAVKNCKCDSQSDIFLMILLLLILSGERSNSLLLLSILYIFM